MDVLDAGGSCVSGDRASRLYRKLNNSNTGPVKSFSSVLGRPRRFSSVLLSSRQFSAVLCRSQQVSAVLVSSP